jgi:hypothetical protein
VSLVDYFWWRDHTSDKQNLSAVCSNKYLLILAEVKGSDTALMHLHLSEVNVNLLSKGRIPFQNAAVSSRSEKALTV